MTKNTDQIWREDSRPDQRHVSWFSQRWSHKDFCFFCRKTLFRKTLQSAVDALIWFLFFAGRHLSRDH